MPISTNHCRHWIRILRQLQTLKFKNFSVHRISKFFRVYDCTPPQQFISLLFESDSILSISRLEPYYSTPSSDQSTDGFSNKSIHWQLAGKAIGLDCEQVGTTWSHSVQPMPKPLLEEVDHVRLNHCKLKPGGNLQTLLLDFHWHRGPWQIPSGTGNRLSSIEIMSTWS